MGWLLAFSLITNVYLAYLLLVDRRQMREEFDKRMARLIRLMSEGQQ